MRAATGRWSSWFAFNLAAVGAAVGLGSIWRFPYPGGDEWGQHLSSRVHPRLRGHRNAAAGRGIRDRTQILVQSAGSGGHVAAAFGYSRSWNWIGVLGTVACVLIMSNYTVIAGWVLAYTWKCASGQIMGLSRPAIAEHFVGFLASPWQVGFWHVVFLFIVGAISARGLNRGIEIANKVRAPGLLILLSVLVAYA